MLSSWKVLQYVALRHGKLEAIFDESLENLSKVKDGSIPFISLENNLNRLQLRMARENQTSAISIERIIDVANFQDKNVLDILSDKAKAVCRILKNGNPIGTGFLVSEDVLITNHHVIENTDSAGQLLAEFGYELDINQVPKKSCCFKINIDKFWLTSSLEKDDNIPFSGLDFSLIGIENTGTNGELLSQFPPVSLDGNLGKIIKGESCVILQHPNGLPKKIVLKDTSFFSETNTCILYESDTLPGSSGAMVVALGTCEIIALHHSGLPRTDDQNRILTKSGTLAQPGTPDAEIDWVGNEGIKISKIMNALKNAALPAHMHTRRSDLLRKSKIVEGQLAASSPHQTTILSKLPKTIPPMPTNKTIINSASNVSMALPPTNPTDFLITAVNKTEIIRRIEAMLYKKYGRPVRLFLAMPSAAEEGSIELFSFSIVVAGNNNEEALDLLKIPEILNAEVDAPLCLNTDANANKFGAGVVPTESANIIYDGLDNWDEEEFLRVYSNSPYVDENNLEGCRKWNWQATRFDTLFKSHHIPSPTKKGVRLVQFDTGFTNHSKVSGGFDLDQDFNFITNKDDANDPRTIGLGKQPGHGTRTASLLIGIADLPLDHNGNAGLLYADKFKLVPYRIAESVILINRQKQLASALDRAISQGFDIITMSMGLPPTIATAKMAKKAYDKGVIWCCAAGNQVKAVVAPAVYPGTIAVAASNPLDKIWTGSSRGDTVDITAPGEDVYVPIWNEQKNEDFSYGNGTSYATPHIAAAAAYWLAKYRDQLNTPEYGGWKRVEAFRQALKISARKPSHFPADVGAGILDMDALVNTAPLPAADLKNAYNGWNENAFFATVQGYGELLKTYWNEIHGWLTGKNRQENESISTDISPLSSTSKILEEALFETPGIIYETTVSNTPDEIFKRYQTLQSFVENATK